MRNEKKRERERERERFMSHAETNPFYIARIFKGRGRSWERETRLSWEF